MPALTPEQEALRQAALTAIHSKGSSAKIRQDECDFEMKANPAAILALLAQLEAAQEAPDDAPRLSMSRFATMDDYRTAQRDAAEAAISNRLQGLGLALSVSQRTGLTPMGEAACEAAAALQQPVQAVPDRKNSRRRFHEPEEKPKRIGFFEKKTVSTVVKVYWDGEHWFGCFVVNAKYIKNKAPARDQAIRWRPTYDDWLKERKSVAASGELSQ